MTAPNTTNNVTVRKLADVAEGMWNKSKNAFVNASGDTMTGRLTLENAPINQIVTGTGVEATSSSSGGTTTYYPAKWNFDLGIATPSAGDQLVIKIPVAGHDNGTFMSTDNGMTYFPVAQSTGTTRFTTRYPVNAYVFIVFEEYTGSSNSGQVNDCYAVAGSTGRSAYKVGCWRVVNDYDSGNTYDRLYTSNGRFRTGTTGCYPYSLVCLDNTDSYSTLVTSNPGTGVNKSVNTNGKFVYPASILYYSANNTTAAGALVSTAYATYFAYSIVDVRYSSNHTVTFTTHKPVYIECTLNGDGTWSPTAVQITQTLRDGYYYIFLGLSYATEYLLSLAPTHPMYYCSDGKLVSAEVARGNITAGTNNGELNVAGTDITVYTHPTDAGNKHIPAGGSSGQFLGWDSAGTAKWVANPNTDIKVKATAKTDNANYKILATASASPTSGAATEAVYDTDITLNPSNNTISANVSGTAASAGKLTTARTTYVTLGTASTSTTRDWSGTTTIPVSGTLGIGNGGTGATSADGARTNLDVYSKSETESLLNGKVVIVTALPATGEAGTTYYVKDTSATGVDKYDEYIWAVDAGATTESWIHVGEKSLDLSEYVNSLTTSGTGPLVKSLSKSGNTLTATMGTISIDDLSDWATDTDVTVSSVTYHTWWPVAPTSSNQVYGLSIYNGRLYRIYNNKGTYSAQAYDTNTTYTNKSLGQGYGTCATEAATAAKIVSMSDYALTTGGIVTVKFTNALCTSATMNINGKGAKPIYIKGAAVTANNAATVSAGDTAYFMYDGTAYHLLGTDRAATNPIVNISRSGTTFTATRLDGTTFTFTQQDNNTTYTQAKLGQGYGTCTTAEATAAKSVTLTGYELEPNGVVAVKFTNGLCASATMSINGKTATPIYINGAAVTSTSCKEVLAGDLAFFIYDGSHYQFICTDRISKNGITGLSISGRTITYTRADGTTGTLTTQDTTYSFDGEYNASTNKVATVSTVTNAVNALDVDDITGFGAGKTLATLTETDGKIAATFQNISITKSQVSDFSHSHGNITNDGKVGTTADYAVVTTTGGAVTATSLATSSPSTSGNTLEFIDTVSQSSKGKILATKKKVTVDDTYSSTGTNPVSGKAIAAAIETLDVTEVGGDGKYIKKIKEDNGKITATVETMDTTPTASSTKAVTSGGIKTALDGKADNENAVYYVVGSNSYAAYSSSSTYTATTNSGPFDNTNSCIYNDYAYYCTTTISTGEAWNSNHWAKIPTAVWAGTNSAITSLYAGLKIAYKVPSYGGSSATQLNLNGLGAKTVYRATGNTTTHLPKNTIVFLAYDGNYWRWADYNSDSWVTTIGAYCETGADTAAKTASSYNTVLTAGMAFLTRFANTNTYSGKITLNVNDQGAKDLWLNGAVSSSSNCTLAKGEYWTYYDGTKFYIWTDGSVHFKGLHLDTPLPDTEIASAATWNAKQDALSTQTAYSAKGTATKVPQITTNSLGQVTGITEVTISGVTPASHTHGNIANGGTLTDTAAAAAGNDYVVIRDADNAKIQTSTIKGTDVADAVSKKHSHSTLTLSTTAQAYDGSHTLALPSTDPYTSARTPTSHSHGNIQNGGTLQTTDVAIANGDKLVVTDASDSNKVARTSVAFDGSTSTKALTQKGTFETFTKVESSSTNGKIKIDGTDTTVYTHPAHTAYTSKGSATKVPQITTDALGHVTSISEVTISGVTPASHTHGNIANGGTLTDTAAAAAGNDYVVIRDADNAKIQTSTIKGTDVADAVSKKHSHSTLTLSTTAQSYDGSHTLALPSTDPYTSARTPASHTHGNIQNGGTLQTNDVTIANGDKLVITDASDSNKVARASAAFDGTTTSKVLTQKGTFESISSITPEQYYLPANTTSSTTFDPTKLRRYQSLATYRSDWGALCLLYDITEFCDGTIVDNSNEQSLFIGTILEARTGGFPYSRMTHVTATIGYRNPIPNSNCRFLYSDSASCYPVIVKENVEPATTWTDGLYTFTVGSAPVLETSTECSYTEINCSAGQEFYVSATFYSTSLQQYKTWAFVNSSGNVISTSTSYRFNGTITAPSGATKLIVQLRKGYKAVSVCGLKRDTPKVYLAIRFTSGAQCDLTYFGRWYTRTTASSSIAARPVLAKYISNTGEQDATNLPAGYEVAVEAAHTAVAGSADKLLTARELAVSLSNTSTTTTFDGSANVTNIKTTGTLPVTNGGTGKTTVTAAEYNLLSNMGTELTGNIDNSKRFVFAYISQDESNGRLAGYRTASSVWSWIKDKMSSDTNVNISGTAVTAKDYDTSTGTINTALDNRLDRYDAVYNRVNTAGGGWVKLADTKPYSSITQVDKPAIWDVMITRCTGETSSEQLCLNVRYDLTGLPSVFFKRFYTIDRTSTHKFAVVVSGVGGGNSSEGKVELWAFLERHWGSIAIREVAGSSSTALYNMNKLQYNYYSYNQNGGTDKPVEDLENNIQVIDSTNIKMATDQDAAKKSDGVYYVVGYSYAAYSSSKTYTQTTSTGPFDDTNSCVYSNQPYYCTTTISTGEAWNSAHWAKIPTAVWTGTNSAITSLYAGLKIAIKVPSYGGSSTTQININGLGAKTLLRNTSNYTSHLPTNSIVFLAYDGTYWRWADYNSDSWVTTIGAYCETGADTAAKTASSYNTVLTAGMAFLTRFANTNTYSGKITLNVNDQGAKDLWLNGAVSSSSNCTLAKGEYWTYYDGIKFCIWTDGSVQLKGLHLDTPLPDTEIASAATWNAKQDAITYMTVAQENELISELGEL